MQRKVNRFTFDAHSVVLFSALVLSSAVSAASPNAASRVQLTPATSSSVNVSTGQAAAALQQALTRSGVSSRSSGSTQLN
ncbi:hypothetical protein [Lampropedia aestuarii]|uniref:hypothetical protein n=1 Tax=Lampropedia aestuarii TaxID=2562762 RepID=UPI002468497B|nr:hypothetical protein [Lampropedia aestuarii]MDH5857483.1 hypothetical protein [Lampropedia aestuarii]